MGDRRRQPAAAGPARPAGAAGRAIHRAAAGRRRRRRASSVACGRCSWRRRSRPGLLAHGRAGVPHRQPDNYREGLLPRPGDRAPRRAITPTSATTWRIQRAALGRGPDRRGAAARRDAGLEPFTVLCCDNLPHNGRLVAASSAISRRSRDDRLRAWIEANVAFPSTMVDRIVPAPTQDDIPTPPPPPGSPTPRRSATSRSGNG